MYTSATGTVHTHLLQTPFIRVCCRHHSYTSAAGTVHTHLLQALFIQSAAGTVHTHLLQALFIHICCRHRSYTSAAGTIQILCKTRRFKNCRSLYTAIPDGYFKPTYSSSSIGPVVNATDVLQPKRLILLTLFPPRLWMFPRSPTDAPTSPHDTRDPSSERWNYVGEN